MKIWAELHLRAVKGQTLTPQEREVYRQGLTERHEEERLPFDKSGLQQLRTNIRQLETQRLLLETKREQLLAQLSQIEASFNPTEKERWGLGD